MVERERENCLREMHVGVYQQSWELRKEGGTRGVRGKVGKEEGRGGGERLMVCQLT